MRNRRTLFPALVLLGALSGCGGEGLTLTGSGAKAPVAEGPVAEAGVSTPVKHWKDWCRRRWPPASASAGCTRILFETRKGAET